MTPEKQDIMKQRRETRLASLKAYRVARVEAHEHEQDIYEAMKAPSASQYLRASLEVQS